MEIMKEGKRMGLMDREYMNRTPEEREAEQRAKRRANIPGTPEQKHKERQLEMYKLMAKGDNLTASERRRLNQIYEENRAYINNSSGSSVSSSAKKRSGIVPIIIFTIIVLLVVAAFYFYPDLANFSI